MSVDTTPNAAHKADDLCHLDLLIEGMHCAACAYKIQEALAHEEGVTAHVDLLGGKASLSWAGAPDRAEALTARIEALGYRASPYEMSKKEQADQEDIAALARNALAAGTGCLAIMTAMAWPFAYSAWLGAGLAVLVLLYAGQPFFAAAWRGLRRGRLTMDAPLALALLLTTGSGLLEVWKQGESHAFGAATMLLFALLLGRYLDQKARGKARAAASRLLSFFSGTATVLEGETAQTRPIKELAPGHVLLVAAGEKIAADGIVTQGESEIDPAAITGETLPLPALPGTQVFAGMVNLTAPLHVRVAAASEDSLLSDVIRLMQKAEQGHARFVRLADRIASVYAPVIFALSLGAFLGWHLWGERSWIDTLFIAASVLVIACPCALGLAVPSVQILASGRLFRAGVLVKSADALEKLAAVDTLVFDKTGTLTTGSAKLANRGDVTTEEVKLAASLALGSRHPLARATVAAHGAGPVFALEVTEWPGQGLEATFNGETIRLGKRAWCGPTGTSGDEKMELWLRQGYKPPRRLAFTDALREDAAAVIYALKKKGYVLHLLSGDRASVVHDVAQAVGIDLARAELSPSEKGAIIEQLRREGRRVLMVGDGLNDAAALACADVSMSPSSALDIAQTAADLVFQGQVLAPVIEALTVAKKADRLVKENFALSFLYNALAIPVALTGLISPMLAAAAMAFSSLSVLLNAQRMRR